MNPAASIVGEWVSLIRDIGVILGVPGLIWLGVKLYNLQLASLRERNEVLAETQYDRALAQIRSQRELFEMERIELAERLAELRGSLSDKDSEISSLKGRLAKVDSSLHVLDRSIEVIAERRPASRMQIAKLAGKYRVRGVNPEAVPSMRDNATYQYEGVLELEVVDVAGGLFRLTWTVPLLGSSQVFRGTGVYKDGVLSAISQAQGERESAPAVVSYRDVGGGRLDGTWVRLGDHRSGVERAERLDADGTAVQATAGRRPAV
ncbi:MAG: hypothetical protein ACREA0_03795 [bacterium]